MSFSDQPVFEMPQDGAADFEDVHLALLLEQHLTAGRDHHRERHGAFPLGFEGRL
jgi:hypothetical protein